MANDTKSKEQNHEDDYAQTFQLYLEVTGKSPKANPPNDQKNESAGTDLSQFYKLYKDEAQKQQKSNPYPQVTAFRSHLVRFINFICKHRLLKGAYESCEIDFAIVNGKTGIKITLNNPLENTEALSKCGFTCEEMSRKPTVTMLLTIDKKDQNAIKSFYEAFEALRPMGVFNKKIRGKGSSRGSSSSPNSGSSASDEGSTPKTPASPESSPPKTPNLLPAAANATDKKAVTLSALKEEGEADLSTVRLPASLQAPKNSGIFSRRGGDQKGSPSANPASPQTVPGINAAAMLQNGTYLVFPSNSREKVFVGCFHKNNFHRLDISATFEGDKVTGCTLDGKKFSTIDAAMLYKGYKQHGAQTPAPQATANASGSK